jgi:hypothetical protein
MSRHFFGAMRDFVFVRLPHYLRAVAIFLIFASPVAAHDASEGAGHC